MLAKINNKYSVNIYYLFLYFSMNTAFEQAYQVYVARKQAERQAHMLQLRQELINSRSTAPLGSASRITSNPRRQRHAAG